MVERLSSWLPEQEVRGSIPGLAATISEIGYLLLPSPDMAERSLKRLKSLKQPTNQQKKRDRILLYDKTLNLSAVYSIYKKMY